MPKPEKNAKKKGGEGFRANTHPFAYTMVTNRETGESIYQRTVSPRIPDSILQTGNRKVLETFYVRNRDKLTAADKRYLGARIHTARLVDELEIKALKDLADGKTPPKPPISRKKGFDGIDMKMAKAQTSNNGCWSCGLELLLRSRGVKMSQEEIRAFRPEYPEGQEKMDQMQQYSVNRDTGASPYDFSDLVLKVLPNASMRSLEFQPLEYPEYMSLYDARDRKVTDQWRIQRAAEYHKRQVRQQFIQAVRQGLLQDRSPVILNRGGSHFVTITGISQDGSRIRFEDSFRTNFGTQYASVDQLIEKYLAPGMHGLGLSWVRDLPAPHKNMAPEKTRLLPELGDGVTADNSGQITFSEESAAPGTNVVFERGPVAGVGMLAGVEATRMVLMDQTRLRQDIGCTLRNQGGTHDAPMQMLVNDHSYLPKRTWLPGDPAIRQKLQELEEREKDLETEKDMAEFEIVDAADLNVLDPRDPRVEPAAGTLDAFEANQKHSLCEQAEGTAGFLANLYALQVYRDSDEKRANDENAQQKYNAAQPARLEIEDLLREQPSPDRDSRIQDRFAGLAEQYPHLNRFRNPRTRRFNLEGVDLDAQLKIGLRMDQELITPALQKRLETAADLALPVIRDMLGEKRGSVELPMTAVWKAQRTLVDEINNFAANRYYIRENPRNDPNLPNWAEKRQQISRAVNVLRSTGTGKNAIGISRSHNSPAYEKMLRTLSSYQQKLAQNHTPSGMENRKLMQDCLDYVSDKMKLRSNESSGQLRFDTVMGVIQQIMPARQFDRLLRKINEARAVGPESSDYVDVNSYGPRTAERFCAIKLRQLLTATGSSCTRLYSEYLAAKQIAEESPQRGKTLLEDPTDPALRQRLERKAKAIRAQPEFRAAVRALPQGETPRQIETVRRNYISSGGLDRAYLNAVANAPVLR